MRDAGGTDLLVVPEVTPGLHVHARLRAADDDDGLDGRTLVEGGIGVGLQRDHAAAAEAFVRGDQHLAAGVLMRSRRAAAENPPKTTEWIAPMRAHASIVMASSGTIGR